MYRLFVALLSFVVRAISAICRSSGDLVIENIALRQQVAALKKERPKPELDNTDRAFEVAVRSAWPKWTNALVIVKPDTVAKWHRERFRRHWGRISRRPGRPWIDVEIR